MRPVLVIGAAALMLSGCQLRLGVDIAVDRGGAGTLTVTAELDRELTELLEQGGFVPARDIDTLETAHPEWDASVVDLEDGGLRVVLTAPFADPAEFTELVRGFHAGLEGADGRLFRDLRLEVDPGGEVRLDGEAGFELPTVPAVEGADVVFDVDDVRALIAERGDEVVRYDLRVTLPEPPAEHDGDVVEGRSVVWHLPVGGMRGIHARSGAARPAWLLPAVAVGAGAAGALTVGGWRRLRRGV